VTLGTHDVPVALARGGPLDGRVPGDAASEEFEVVMADDSHHLYVVTDEWGESASGVRARVYVWRAAGRPPARQWSATPVLTGPAVPERGAYTAGGP